MMREHERSLEHKLYMISLIEQLGEYAVGAIMCYPVFVAPSALQVVGSSHATRYEGLATGCTIGINWISPQYSAGKINKNRK